MFNKKTNFFLPGISGIPAGPRVPGGEVQYGPEQVVGGWSQEVYLGVGVQPVQVRRLWRQRVVDVLVVPCVLFLLFYQVLINVKLRLAKALKAFYVL